MSEVLVSICCLTYNHENYISDCLKGFISQKTSFPYEILIYDDASSDKTQEKIKEYEKKNPRLIKPIYQTENQLSKGVGVNIKYNFLRAKGKYIALCEGDDYWTDPLKLQKQVDFLENNHEYVITYHDAKIINEKGELIKDSKLKKELQRDFSSDELIKGKMILTLTMCFRNVIKEFPPEMSKVKNGDKFLTSLLGNYGKGKYLSNIENAVYRKHTNAIWSSLTKTKQIYFNGETRAWLARYYQRLGNQKYFNYFNEEAKHHFEKVLLKFSNTNTYDKNIFDSIRNEFKDVILNEVKLHLNNSAVQSNEEYSLDLAEQLLSDGKLEQAEIILKKILEKDLNCVDALNDLVVLEIMKRNYIGALDFIERVLKLEPENEIAIENFVYIEQNVNKTLLKNSINYRNVKERFTYKISDAKTISIVNQIIKVGSRDYFENKNEVKINWAITRKCNFTCSYCTVYNNNDKFRPFIQFKQAINKIATLNKDKYEITLTGGEPTIYPQYIELLKYLFEKLGNKVSILTISNLSRTNRFFNDFVTKLNKYKDRLIFVASYHFEFAKENEFLENLKILVNNGHFVKVQIMAHPDKMKEVRSLELELSKIVSPKLKYQIMVIRENYGSVPDKRYSPKDLEWLKQFYTSHIEEKNILLYTIDENGDIKEDKYAAPELNAKGLNNYKGMICEAGLNNFSINENGKIDRAVCFRKEENNSKNIFSDRDNLADINQPIICPFERCGCTADLKIPKYHKEFYEADNLKNEKSLKLNYLNEKLKQVSWNEKAKLYEDSFEYYKNLSPVENPAISVIVISWRLHPDNYKNFEILEKQRKYNFELIFVNNGADEKEFKVLEPFINKYIKLNKNTGAYLARNIGSVFSESPILLFLEDDGIPFEDLIEQHLAIHNYYNVIAIRGKYISKTQNQVNYKQTHYDLGKDPIPYYLNLEGNCSIKKNNFFEVKGWDDFIRYGYGGADLSYRLKALYPNQEPSWYFPNISIYHNYTNNEDSFKLKYEKQESSLKRLCEKNSGFENFIENYRMLSFKYYSNKDLKNSILNFLGSLALNRKKQLIHQLKLKNWLNKEVLYSKYFEYEKSLKNIKNPKISIIVISWRLHKDNLKSFKILQQQRKENYELIFVNNGADEKEFKVLEPYIDKYVKLNENTGAYLARNIGALFAEAPILFFLEDDGIPEIDLIEQHIIHHQKYEIVALRGVYVPKSENNFNKEAHHYYLGEKTFPRYSELEGNSSYHSKAFFNIGGWDDEIIFGGGGIDLSIRLFERYPLIHKQIYSPKPIIYHDFVKDEEHLINKRQKQNISFERLKQKHPNWTDYQISWNSFKFRDDLLKIKNLSKDDKRKKNIVMFWYQNDWGIYGRRNEMLAKTFANNENINKIIHIEPPINLDRFENSESNNLDANIVINKKRFSLFNDTNVITYTPSYRGELTELKIKQIFDEIQNILLKLEIKDYILWLYPPHYMSSIAITRMGENAQLIVSDIVDDHRQYVLDRYIFDNYQSLYNNIISNSDICFSVSEKLCNEFKHLCENIYFVPNAVDEKLLNYKSGPKPKELENIKNPIIGYVGALSFRLDIELIAQITSKLDKYSFVFIGTSPSESLKEICKKENIHILPPVNHELVKDYINNFDICIIPHSINDATSSMNPLKIYEYLALGKQVVSTNISGIEKFSEYVLIANSPNEFIKNINKIIIDKKLLHKVPDEIIKHNTWNNRVKSILKLLDSETQFKYKNISENSKDAQMKNQLSSTNAVQNAENNNYYGHTRPEVQALVNQKASRILDVGCGKGEMAFQLKMKLNAEVWGIEYVQSAAEKASEKLDNVIAGKIEDALQKLPNNYFDTIIFADVLEHLTNPEFILIEIKKKLKPTGEIVASIPNVRHWSVLLDLVQGNWNYADAGLLDRTHFKFFTKNSIVKMFNTIGINDIKLSAVNYPPTDPNHKKVWENFNKSVNGIGLDTSTLSEEGIHYQYLVKAQMKSELVSIVVPNFNQLKYTKQFVDSVFENTSNEFELIIVDNASDKETNKYLKELSRKQNVKVIFNKENLGFPKAVNQGILKTKGQYILIANNDIIVTKDWLTKMLEVAAKNNQIGLVGPISNAVSGIQIDREANYTSVKEMHNYAKGISFKNKNQILEFPRLAFLCTLVKKEVIDKIGGLDERFSPGNFEDDDFCLRAQLTGYKTVIVKDVFIHHYGSVSFKQNGEKEYGERLKINEQKFINKWGTNPEGIWLKGEQIKKKSVNFPINNDHFVKSLSRAFIYIDDEEYDLALESLKLALEKFDSSERIGYEQITKEELLNIAGNIALSKNNLDSAKDFFEKELEQNPSSSSACFGLGEVFSNAELYEESKTMLEWAIVNNKNNQNAKVRLKEINIKLNLSEDHNSLLSEQISVEES